MSKVCAKHVEQPAFIYGECVGCELETLRAEAKALREEVERSNRITIAMALDISAVGEALGIPGEQQEGGTGEFIELIRELQDEVSALRARVVVVPDSILPHRERSSVDPGFNEALRQVARLNGKTVSEGLLRRIAAGDRGLWAAIGELRAVLGEGKEDGDA